MDEINHPELPGDGWWACQFPERAGTHDYKKHWRHGCAKCWIDLEASIRQHPTRTFRGLYFKRPTEYAPVPFRDIEKMRQWWFSNLREENDAR